VYSECRAKCLLVLHTKSMCELSGFHLTPTQTVDVFYCVRRIARPCCLFCVLCAVLHCRILNANAAYCTSMLYIAIPDNATPSHATG